MVRNHAITPAQAQSAYGQKLTLQKPSTADDVKAPGFVHWVAAQLEKTYGGELLKNGGLTVTTSLDWSLQSIAERQVRAKVMALGAQHVTDGARRMGVQTLTQPATSYQPSLTLGGYEVPLIDMATGASTLAAQGTYRHPQAILKIVAHDGSTLYRFDAQTNGKPALSPQVSF